MKFYLSYSLGWDEPPNIKTCMGTMVHKVMEILAKVKVANQHGTKSVEDEATGKFYLKTFDINKLIDKVYKYYVKAFTNHTWTDEQYNTVKLWVKKQ
jgi:sulfite reductase beta subunit-like hemoprotein